MARHWAAGHIGWARKRRVVKATGKNNAGVGSKKYWETGKEPGSRYYWENGQAAGSRYYWKNGTGQGSKYYWLKGNGPGSRHYWLNGKDSSGYLVVIFLAVGLIDEQGNIVSDL